MKRLKTVEASVRCLPILKQIGMVCFAFLFSIFSTNLFATGINANATSASCTNSTLNTYSGTSNLQANWQANPININWYNGDTLLDVQDAADGCNYDGALTVPSNVPTKTGYTFNGWKLRGLPDGYTRLEYIQTSGTQYINTGITSSSSTFFYLEVMFESGGGYRFFGNAKALAGFGSGGTSNLYVISTSTPVISNMTNVLGKKLTINYKGTNVKINGVDYACSQATTGPAMYINARADSLSSRVASAKWYRVQIGSGTTIQGDFIPAKRNNDNVVGMFDVISQTFFTNVGSGTFTAGPAVQ